MLGKIQAVAYSTILAFSCILEPVSYIRAAEIEEPVNQIYILEEVTEESTTVPETTTVEETTEKITEVETTKVEETTEMITEVETITEAITEIETTTVAKPKDVENGQTLSEEDINLIAIVTMAEAEGESELGKRLVIDTVLNRIDSDKFPNSASGVIYQQNQFTSMTNGRSDRCYVKDEIKKLVEEEIVNRTDTRVLFFRTNHYFSFGTPVRNEGAHYFSSF